MGLSKIRTCQDGKGDEAMTATEKPLNGEDRLRIAIKWLSSFDIVYLKYEPYTDNQNKITIIGKEREER